MRTFFLFGLAAVAAVVPATALAGTIAGFSTGSTTIADVEQGLGAPMDTVTQPDGGLTLYYPVSRLGGRDPWPQARTVALKFDTVFVLRDARVIAVRDSRLGYASR